MALFYSNWSTPERRRLDQSLPTMPNEIYLSIIELIAPPAAALAPHQLNILSNLSRICRFFSNNCLPRIFEFVQFSSPLSSSRRLYPPPEASLGSILSIQIAKKQPLALALAQSVRYCRFLRCRDDLEKRCIAAMSYMNNITKLYFVECKVDGKYWSMLVALSSLDDLAFERCEFLQDLVFTKPEKDLKLNLSRLWVMDCVAEQIIVFIDTGYLRTMVIDLWVIEEADWLQQSAITELHLYAFQNDPFDDWYQYYRDLPKLNVVLAKVPWSLQELHLAIDETSASGRTVAADGVENILEDQRFTDCIPPERSFRISRSIKNVLQYSCTSRCT